MEEKTIPTDNRKPILTGVVIGLIILAFGIFASVFSYQIRKNGEAEELKDVIEIVQRNIQQTIQESYSILLTLSLTVDDNGVVNNFEEVAKQLHENYPSADILELVPGGVIEYVYPVEGNESVVGYDIANDPKVSAEVQKATKLGTIYFAGPITLRQGNEAVIGRLPIHRNNELWGFSAVVIYLESLIQRSGILNFSGDRYYFQLSKINPNTGEEEFFLDEIENVDLSYFQVVNFPEGDWRLYATKVSGKIPEITLFIYLSLSVLGALLCGYLTFLLLEKPIELEKLLAQKSHELLESREQFRKNSELLTSVLESPESMIIFSLDKEYNYLAFNNNHQRLVKKLFNRTPFPGDNVLELMGDTRAQLLKVKYDRALNGESFEYMHELKHEGKSEYWQNRFSPIRNKSAEIIGLTVFSNNITQRIETERKLAKNERRYRTLISNSPFCIHELNTGGELISINKAGLSMFSMEKEEDFLGITYDKLLSMGQVPEILGLFERALKGESSEFEFEKDNRFYISSFIPLKNEHGMITRVMGITQDITERHKSEEFIENSLKEKITLLSEIHHRVKNNLAIVSGLLELQKYETNDQKLTAAFEQSINRIISIAMVHELMYNTSDLSSIDVHSYLKKLIPAISDTMQDKSKNVRFDIDVAEYRLNINEAIPLGLLLNELITNSFKYAFNGNADNIIRISLQADHKTISIEYEDNGVGFPEHVDFDKPKNLGLNLIHTQIQQLNASYTAHTRPGFRLKFTFQVQGKGAHSNIGHDRS